MMKKIVFYCGVEGDSFNHAYVSNGREYLKMTHEERLAALTGIIAELNQERDFVANQVNAQGTSSKPLDPAQ
jgi:hypothetical protein